MIRVHGEIEFLPVLIKCCDYHSNRLPRNRMMMCLSSRACVFRSIVNDARSIPKSFERIDVSIDHNWTTRIKPSLMVRNTRCQLKHDGYSIRDFDSASRDR